MNANAGDKIEVEHTPGPNGIHEIVEVDGREAVLENGARVYEHELEREYLTLVRAAPHTEVTTITQ